MAKQIESTEAFVLLGFYRAAFEDEFHKLLATAYCGNIHSIKMLEEKASRKALINANAWWQERNKESTDDTN